MNFRLLLREPALLLDSLETALVMLVALGLSISGDQQNYIVAVIIAVIGIAKAWATHPFPVTLITDLSRAVFVLAATFGVHFLTPDKTAIMVTFIGTFMTLVQRIQVTPTNSAVTAPAGAGAGPVTGEA
jgi:hypothetical protein